MKCGGNGLRYLSQIFVYPIKSARGIEVDETRLDLAGLVRDRRWMLVDDNGLGVTQRTQPRMVLMAPRFEGEDLIVEAPEMPPLRIRSWAAEGEWVPVRIWNDDLRVPHPDQRYSDWFSSFLGQSCRLVHLPEVVKRPVEAPYDKAPWHISFADSFPVLVIGQTSLDLLNEKLEAPVTMQRFRPNLVIAGSAAHEEDEWARVRLGDVELATGKACSRCSIPLVDPLTAETGVEPLRTLAQYRKLPNTVKFGHKMLVTTPGALRTGEALEVLDCRG